MLHITYIYDIIYMHISTWLYLYLVELPIRRAAGGSGQPPASRPPSSSWCWPWRWTSTSSGPQRTTRGLADTMPDLLPQRWTITFIKDNIACEYDCVWEKWASNEYAHAHNSCTRRRTRSAPAHIPTLTRWPRKGNRKRGTHQRSPLSPAKVTERLTRSDFWVISSLDPLLRFPFSRLVIAGVKTGSGQPNCYRSAYILPYVV